MKTFLSSHFFKMIYVVISCMYFASLGAQEQLTNLPTFYINTENGAPILSKEDYVKATLTIKSQDESEELSDFVTEIRGRGNSTWGMAKKPYRIKLDKKRNLLNLPAKAKNWVLLANYADKTLMRNAVAMKISQEVGLEFTPSSRFIDLVLNGQFLGSYWVSDQIQVIEDLGRVPIEEQETTATELPDISGGYLLEIDGFAASEPVWFTTGQGLKITVKYPKDDEINQSQLNYIKDYINEFENVLFSANYADSENGYRKWVDENTLVNWYIACELTGNSDSFWQTYIYKKHNDDKLYFGPLWDYDIAFNNDMRLGDAVNKLMRENAHNPRTWIQRMWTDEWFRTAVNTRWQELVQNGIEETLLNYVDETTELIDASQERNFQKWNILNRRVYQEQFLFPTYMEGVNYLKTYISRRIAFLTQSFESSKPEDPSEPFVPDNYYYMIMNKRTNNVISVVDASMLSGALLAMYAPDSNDDTDDRQLFEIETVSQSDALFRIINKSSGLAMAGNGRGNSLKQVEIDNNDGSQLWKIVPVFTGDTYAIVNKVSNYSVNNSGGNFADGTPVIEYDNNINDETKLNQHWYFQKIEEIIETSISENKLENLKIRITDGILYLNNLEKNTTVRILNMQGYTVASKNNQFGDISIQLPAGGIYILQIVSGGNTYHHKFINK